jgi:hypothetical protein
MKIIVTKYEARCADCGAFLPAGTKVKWYGRGRVYGLECHEKPATASTTRTKKWLEAAEGARRMQRGTLAMDWGKAVDYDTYENLHEGEPRGLTMSRLDPYGAYSPDGELIGRVSCGCEDYPCCGH